MTSILDPWRFEEHRELYDRLALLGPADAWGVIEMIRRAELQHLDQAEVDLWASHVEPRVALAEFLGPIDAHEFAREVSEWMLTRTIHFTFLITRFLRAGGDVQALDVDLDLGRAPALGTSLESGRGAVVLPLHCGPIEAAVGLLAFQHPTTLVVSQTANIPDSFPSPIEGGSVSVEVLRAPSPTVMVEVAASLKRGRAVVFPPEFTTKKNDRTEEFDLLGQTVHAPVNPARVAKLAGVPVFLWTLEPTADLGYRLHVDGPHDVPTGAAITTVYERIFTLVGESLRARPVEWEGWAMFDRMLGTKLPSPIEAFNLMN